MTYYKREYWKDSTGKERILERDTAGNDTILENRDSLFHVLAGGSDSRALVEEQHTAHTPTHAHTPHHQHPHKEN